MAGYSSTPLAKKLGIKDGFSIRLINAPEYYFELFADLPANVTTNEPVNKQKELIHFFTIAQEELVNVLPLLKKEIRPNGSIWVSWPKRASKIQTTVNETLVRETALSIGLVDIKVCAVDDIWSGLKLVIPVKDR